ncbi:uncharacterized protein MEPE_00335 [Melanopsichium pennsylvanicum]|uniref:F-box domain-containing protein n=1 Tax=Melanopsichium pennsylvanicum TaxID=63383 RepID=A0AAJ5C2J5_9BASI|nr:uncharacterized protein MEPE_00335 [Melanopsichium pennsylvanicum]
MTQSYQSQLRLSLRSDSDQDDRFCAKAGFQASTHSDPTPLSTTQPTLIANNDLMYNKEISAHHLEKAIHDASDMHEVKSRTSRIETLPHEVLLHLSHFLDLTGLILLSTATCRTLSTIFGQFDRELLYLEPTHRLNLAEWREAARNIDAYILAPSRCPSTDDRLSSSILNMGITYQNDAKANGAGKGSHTTLLHELTRDESLIDLDLFQAVLGFLQGDSSSKRKTPQFGLASHQAPGIDLTTATRLQRHNGSRDNSVSVGSNHIRTLHLTGWHGIPGAFLIQQLRLQPSLRQIHAVVKTERADMRIWSQAASDDQELMHHLQRSSVAEQSNTQFTRKSAAVTFGQRQETDVTSISNPALDLGACLENTSPPSRRMMQWFKRCTSTQIIVQVGKRRPRRHGQAYLRGEGLQMGFQGFCIDVMTTTGQESNQDIAAACVPTDSTNRIVCSSGTQQAQPESTPAAELQASNKSTGEDLDTGCQQNTKQKTIPTPRQLHVILQGREEEHFGAVTGTAADQNKENEEMFETSLVICNHCKERIKF